MSSSKSITLSNGTKLFHHLSEDEDDTNTLYSHEPLYHQFKFLQLRPKENKHASPKGTLNELPLEPRPTSSAGNHLTLQNTIHSLTEGGNPDPPFMKLVEQFLSREPLIRSDKKVRIKCSSVKRVSAREIASTYILRNTLSETRRIVYFIYYK